MLLLECAEAVVGARFLQTLPVQEGRVQMPAWSQIPTIIIAKNLRYGFEPEFHPRGSMNVNNACFGVQCI